MTRFITLVAAALLLAISFFSGAAAYAQAVTACQTEPFLLALGKANAVPDPLEGSSAATRASSYAALPCLPLRPAIARNRVSLRLPPNEKADMVAFVLDKKGRQIARLPVIRGRMDLGTLAPGAYFLEVQGSATYRATFIKA